MLFELKDITKIYKTKEKVETHALNHINLMVEEGDMLAIVGTSGSGKTTLLNVIGAMDSATSGTYTFGDTVVTELSGNKLNQFRKKNMGFVFQNFELLTQYNVYENVEIPLFARNVKNRKKRILPLLESLGIADLRKKYPNELSGGQKQRVAIARALAADTPVILADEPTGAVDHHTGQVIMDIFKTLKENGKTVIIVTHDMNIAKQCDRIVRIEDGKVVQ